MLKNITKIKKFYLTPRISSSIMMKDLIKTLKQANNELAESIIRKGMKMQKEIAETQKIINEMHSSIAESLETNIKLLKQAYMNENASLIVRAICNLEEMRDTLRTV